MKFPRNARIFKGHIDVAPFAGVFLCLLIFVLLSTVMYTPGVAIQLPVTTAQLQGVEGPKLFVALGTNGQYYFQNQAIFPNDLKRRLTDAAEKSGDPLTLVILADKAVTVERLGELLSLGQSAGITNFVQAVLPRVFDSAPINGR